VVQGARKFSHYQRSGEAFTFKGLYLEDYSHRDAEKSVIVAIDARNFHVDNKVNFLNQYSTKAIRRETIKAFIGFKGA
jgi:hypothetical protein